MGFNKVAKTFGSFVSSADTANQQWSLRPKYLYLQVGWKKNGNESNRIPG